MLSWVKSVKALTRLFIQIIKKTPPKEKGETNVIDLSPIISAKNLALIENIEIAEFSKNQLVIRLQTKEPIPDNWLWLLRVRITRGMVFNSTLCKVVKIENNGNKKSSSYLLVLKPENEEKLPFGKKYEEWYKKRGGLDELKKVKLTLLAPEFRVKSKNFCLFLNDEK